MKQVLKGATQGMYKLMPSTTRKTTVRVVNEGLNPADKADIEKKIAFFLPSVKHIEYVAKLSPGLLSSSAAIFHTLGDKAPSWLRAHPGRFDVNRHNNPLEGWNWIDAATYVDGHQPDIQASKQRFINLHSALTKGAAVGRPCYVFGTGPSLEKAIEHDWSDGIRVVCNTIVRDKALWDHMNADIIVAGDGIYHFGFTDFAKAFRADLKTRLEASSTYFMYPARFDVIIQRELGHLVDRLLPIPVGTHTSFYNNLLDNFALPALGNILNLLLLPVGCNLSKTVGLWGFDGRAPDDKLFWANSSKHSYAELIPSLQEAHPAFFDHNVPKHDPEKYIRSVHGDVLENCLTDAEKLGWTFKMLHHSWTPTLAKRHVDER
ncbi:MAG: hypothetical protein KGL90_11695 [Burkholderiales bacterium]|nr:hypothetical protein [Burkholderiales bacterium]